jgi:hypothetical protein
MTDAESGAGLQRTLTTLAGLLAGFAASVYVTGGLILSARLGLRELPSTAVVSQLPREFLVSLGLLAVGPPVLVAGLVYAFLPSPRQTRETRRRLLALAVACTVTVSAFLIAKAPFAAKACLEGGGSASGFFIGEAPDRTYLGESGETPRRIISLPTARVQRLLVGGDAELAQCG